MKKLIKKLKAWFKKAMTPEPTSIDNGRTLNGYMEAKIARLKESAPKEKSYKIKFTKEV